MQIKYFIITLVFCISCRKAILNDPVSNTLVIWQAMMASNVPAVQKVVMRHFELEFGLALQLKPNGKVEESGPQGAPCGLHNGNGTWRFSGNSIIVKMNVEYQDIDETKKPKGDFVECKTIRRRYTYTLRDFALMKNANAGYDLKVKREDGQLRDVSITRPENSENRQGSIFPEFEKGLDP